MRRTRRAATTGLAIAITAGLLAAGSTSVSAVEITGAAVPNPSFEGGWTGGKLTCWNVSPAAGAKLTVTKNAHSGAWAGHVTGLTAGPLLEVTTDRTEACRIPVTAGQAYTMGLWQRSTAGATPVVYAYSAAGWSRWFTGSPAPASTTLRSTVVPLPVVPSGVTALSVGLALPATGTVVLDDVALTRVLSAPARFAAPQANGLITNEFAYWSPANAARVESKDWEMTSGSLFARGGNGWTGAMDNRSPNAGSTAGTNSAVFRLNTRDYTFRDVDVRFNLNIARLASTTSTPAVDWDGVHVFLHYQSQYELYYASVARRDGHVVIKKKCKGGVYNGGSYYVLGSSELAGQSFPLATWQQAGASVRTNPNGTVTIVLYRNGKAVTSATDTGVGCAPITNAGATGIRGDNTEFDFNNFTVTPLA